MSDSDNPLFPNRADGAFGGQSLSEVIQNPVLARDYGFDGNPFDQYRDDDHQFTGRDNASQDTNIDALWYMVGAEAVVVALILYFAFIF